MRIAIAIASAAVLLFAGNTPRLYADGQQPGAAPSLPQKPQTPPVNVQAMVAETQWMSRSDKTVGLVWWIPAEFWRASAPASSPREQIDELVKILTPYTVVTVAFGDVGPLGGVTWATEDALRSRLAIVDSTGREYAPIATEQVSADAKNLAAILKPILTNFLGPMGQNMHFVYFPALTAAGTPIADLFSEGSFSVRLGSDVHRWRLPVGSFLPEKVCPVDGERLNGAWKFCPIHGKELGPGL